MMKKELTAGAGGHFFYHRQDQFAIAVIQARSVAADLAEEAQFILGKLRQALGAIAVPGIGKELGERNLHGAGDFRKGVQRRNGVTILHAGEVAPQQAGTLFDIALGHPLLQPVASDALTDIHTGNGPSSVLHECPE